MPTRPLYVTPHGRVLRHQRAASLIALMEGMRVSLREPLPVTDRRGL